MNVAQARPRTWTPHIILFSIVLHAVVIYYIAVAFKIVPPPYDPTREPPTVQAVRLDPPPPPPLEPDRIIERPRFRPHQPLPAPVRVDVPPIPYPPQPPAESTANANVIAVNTPIPEEPVSQVLPAYPRHAIERDVQGRVVLSITILPDGNVRDVQIVSAQPRGYFEEAALRSVRTWRYRPSNVIRTRVIVHMDFELKDG